MSLPICLSSPLCVSLSHQHTYTIPLRLPFPLSLSLSVCHAHTADDQVRVLNGTIEGQLAELDADTREQILLINASFLDKNRDVTAKMAKAKTSYSHIIDTLALNSRYTSVC